MSSWRGSSPDSGLLLLSSLGGGEEAHVDGVHLATGNPGVQNGIHRLLALDPGHALEVLSPGHHVVIPAVALYFHLAARQGLLQLALDFLQIHNHLKTGSGRSQCAVEPVIVQEVAASVSPASPSRPARPSRGSMARRASGRARRDSSPPRLRAVRSQSTSSTRAALSQRCTPLRSSSATLPAGCSASQRRPASSRLPAVSMVRSPRSLARIGEAASGSSPGLRRSEERRVGKE